jgi:hypothetical protein
MKTLAFSLFACVSFGLVLACSGSSNSLAPAAKCSSSGNACPNGQQIQACVTQNADGACASEYLSVGSQTFDCTSCSDCAQAAQSASQACISGASSGGNGGGGGDAGSGFSLGGGGADPYVGSWSCTEMAQANGGSSSTSTATFVVTSPAPGQLVLTAATDAGSSCALRFTEMGSAATLDAGQACDAASSTNGYVTTLTEPFAGGSASVNGNGMSVFLQYSWSLTATPDDGGAPLMQSGSGTLTATCEKL